MPKHVPEDRFQKKRCGLWFSLFGLLSAFLLFWACGTPDINTHAMLNLQRRLDGSRMNSMQIYDDGHFDPDIRAGVVVKGGQIPPQQLEELAALFSPSLVDLYRMDSLPESDETLASKGVLYRIGFRERMGVRGLARSNLERAILNFLYIRHPTDRPETRVLLETVDRLLGLDPPQ